MEKKQPGNELKNDATRESLIAISYKVPNEDAADDKKPEKKNNGNVIEHRTDNGDDKYRSELISISSSSPSPNEKTQPAFPTQPDT